MSTADREHQKKVFLLVSNEETKIAALKAAVNKEVPGATIYIATEGSEASSKYQNDPAAVVITDSHLGKSSGIKLVENIMNASRVKHAETSFIILAEAPDTEHFVDQVLQGTVQFLAAWTDPSEISRAIAKALNPSASRSHSEFISKSIKAGEVLIREGESGKNVYILRKGQMKATHLKGGKEVVIGQIETGEFVGEMAYINGEPRSATVIAITDCELAEIPIDKIDSVLMQKPAWAKALMANIAKRLKAANNQG